MAPHRKIFNIAMTGISRVLLLREHALGRIGPGYRGGAAGVIASHQNILRGGIILDAVFVEPEIAPANSAVVLCHGIGEVVDEWFPVQALLAQNGVGSLVFDYSGYGLIGRTMPWPPSSVFNGSCRQCRYRYLGFPWVAGLQPR